MWKPRCNQSGYLDATWFGEGVGIEITNHPCKNHCLPGLVNVYKKLLKMAIEIVDLPMESMVIFHSFLYVYQRVILPISYMTPVHAFAGWFKKLTSLTTWFQNCHWNVESMGGLASGAARVRGESCNPLQQVWPCTIFKGTSTTYLAMSQCTSYNCIQLWSPHFNSYPRNSIELMWQLEEGATFMHTFKRFCSNWSSEYHITGAIAFWKFKSFYIIKATWPTFLP